MNDTGRGRGTVRRVRVRPGEVWRCGEHRVMCGDATDRESVGRLCAGDRPVLLLTDPPYGVAVGDRNMESGRGVRARLANDDLPEDGMRRLWSGAFRAAEAVMSGKAAFCVFTAQGPLMVAMAGALAEAGLEWRHEWVWVKPHMVMGRCDRHYRHEPILYGWRRGGSHEWKGDRKLGSVLEYGPDARGFGHPTVKPKALMADLLTPLARPGEAVIDPFLGSGSTLLACETAGRRCLGMDLDPKFASMAVSRWQAFTGKPAEREA